MISLPSHSASPIPLIYPKKDTVVTITELGSDSESSDGRESRTEIIYEKSSQDIKLDHPSLSTTQPNIPTHAPLLPCTTLLQVRAGKRQPLGNGGQVSAIRKSPQEGLVRVTEVGVVGDDQVYAMHGGVDKALHQYCADHYSTWKAEKPDKAHLFEFGGYGENLVTKGMHEGNVCIGDRYSIGDEVVVEVSEPRMPCATLNRRFEWRRASVRTQATGRAGWYLRVLQTGFIKAGDQMRLLDRPNPAWTITFCQQLLWAKIPDRELLLRMSELEALGKEIKGVAAAKSKGLAGEDAIGRLHDVSSAFVEYTLIHERSVSPRVKEFTFRKVQALPAGTKPKEFRRFPFVQLKFGPAECYDRSYSVVSGNLQEFTLGVALDRNSRGGSRWLHEELKPGAVVRAAKGPERTVAISQKNEEQLARRRRIFIIGGIGVTAFLLEIKRLQALDYDFEIHYAVPSMRDAAFSDDLPSSKTKFYAKDQHRRLSVRKLIPSKLDAEIYCCGPSSLMAACQEQLDALNYPDDLVHMESFGEDSAVTNETFEVEVEGTGRTIEVSPTKTLLDVLNDAGFDVPSSCRVGNCGLCAVDYVQGEVQHRGFALTKKEKCSSMLSCVSRAKGKLRIVNEF